MVDVLIPEQQGLKPTYYPGLALGVRVDVLIPEQQGLKRCYRGCRLVIAAVDVLIPEQQGLKHMAKKKGWYDGPG